MAAMEIMKRYAGESWYSCGARTGIGASAATGISRSREEVRVSVARDGDSWLAGNRQDN